MTKTTQTKPKSLLSSKDQKLPWQAQIQKLRRIAVRATAKADHYEELLDTYYVSYPDGADETRAEVPVLRAKAKAAAEEMLAIAKANGDERVRGL